MDSASPVGDRVDSQPIAVDADFTPTGNFAGNFVTWRCRKPSRGATGNATTRLRPRYRDGDHRSAGGDGHRV